MPSQESMHSDPLPENYTEVTYWRLSQHTKLLVMLNVVGIIGMVVSLALFLAWGQLWQPLTLGEVSAARMLTALIMIILTVVSHELVHGAALRYYGARPTYGVLWKEMMFYATAAGYAFPRNAYVVIALAPLLGLGGAGLALLAAPLPAWLRMAVILCAAFNTGSAVGDLWLVRIALSYPRWAYIVDEKDGLRVFMPAAPDLSGHGPSQM